MSTVKRGILFGVGFALGSIAVAMASQAVTMMLLMLAR